ncbi:hypothetical protein LPJ56_005468, partial [Coemansia sp. RSA 2599]
SSAPARQHVFCEVRWRPTKKNRRAGSGASVACPLYAAQPIHRPSHTQHPTSQHARVLAAVCRPYPGSRIPGASGSAQLAQASLCYFASVKVDGHGAAAPRAQPGDPRSTRIKDREPKGEYQDMAEPPTAGGRRGQECVAGIPPGCVWQRRVPSGIAAW